MTTKEREAAGLLVHHQTINLAPGIDVDRKIAAIVKHCWRLGLATLGCCQGDPEPGESEAAVKNGTPDHPVARMAVHRV